jgi:hypothetical protein
MADLTDAEIDAAHERGRIAQQTEPRAASARHDRESGRIIVELTNGCIFAFPPRMALGLETATDNELATVEILGAGYGLHWEDLDATIPATPSKCQRLGGSPGAAAGAQGRTRFSREVAALALDAAKAPPSHLADCPV